MAKGWSFDALIAALKGAAFLNVGTSSDMAIGTSTDLVPTVQAVMSLLAKRNFTNKDWIRIPDVDGGLIVQWMSVTPAGGQETVSLPRPFPIEFFGAVAQMWGDAGNTYGYTTTEPAGLTGVKICTRTALQGLSATPVFLVAIGR